VRCPLLIPVCCINACALCGNVHDMCVLCCSLRFVCSVLYACVCTTCGMCMCLHCVCYVLCTNVCSLYGCTLYAALCVLCALRCKHVSALCAVCACMCCMCAMCSMCAMCMGYAGCRVGGREGCCCVLRCVAVCGVERRCSMVPCVYVM